MLLRDELGYKGTPWIDCDRNMVNIPITWIELNEQGAEEFNKIYEWILNNNIRKYVPTKSGGISIKSHLFRRPCYNIKQTNGSIEIIYIDFYAYRFRLRSFYKESEDDNWSVSGSRGFTIFKRLVEQYGGDLTEFAIPNGKQVKATMPMPMISCKEEYIDQTLENVWHADINSAYMAGIREWAALTKDTNPNAKALYDAIGDLYEHRKSTDADKKHYKSVLNVSYGFMQSEWCCLKGRGYALANLSKIAMESCISKLVNFSKEIEAQCGEIIAYNTDGVFFKLDNPSIMEQYKNPNTNLGEFKIDLFCKKLRFKSKGSYEYITDKDEYHPVVRGSTNMDLVKPRSEWQWGDIYNSAADVIRYQFIEGIGVIKK